MRTALGLVLLVAVAAAGEPPAGLTLTAADGGRVAADLYDAAGDGVVLVHGAVFDKASWAPLAGMLQAKGLRVLAVDLRGKGKSTAGSRGDAGRYEDVLAGVRELHRRGARRVSILGASMGAAVAAEAVAAAKKDEVARVVYLSPAALPPPERLRGPAVFVASVDEPAIGRIREDFARAPEPKRLVLIPGSAHAQHAFTTPYGARLTAALVEALTTR